MQAFPTTKWPSMSVEVLSALEEDFCVFWQGVGVRVDQLITVDQPKVNTRNTEPVESCLLELIDRFTELAFRRAVLR